jgi:hypothetical protein
MDECTARTENVCTLFSAPLVCCIQSQAQDFNYVVCGPYRGSKFSLNSIQTSTVHEHKDIIANYIKAQLLQTQNRSIYYHYVFKHADTKTTIGRYFSNVAYLPRKQNLLPPKNFIVAFVSHQPFMDYASRYILFIRLYFLCQSVYLTFFEP